jgi:uncharacterized protein
MRKQPYHASSEKIDLFLFLYSMQQFQDQNSAQTSSQPIAEAPMMERAQESEKSTDAASMTTAEAGHIGGEVTKRLHGREFFQRIGRKGGKTVSRNREHMAEIGRRGGKSKRQYSEEEKVGV